MQNIMSDFVKETKEMAKKLLKSVATANPIIITFVIYLKSIIFLSMFRVNNYNAILGSDRFNSINEEFIKTYHSRFLSVPHLAIIGILTCFGFLFKNKARTYFMQFINILVSLLLIFDLNYYRATGSFLSIRHILSPELFNPANKQLMNFNTIDLIFIADIIIFFILSRLLTKIGNVKIEVKRNVLAFGLCFILCVGTVQRYHEFLDVKDITNGDEILFKPTNWVQKYWLDNMSPLGFQGFDIFSEYAKNKETNNIQKQGMDDVTEWINYNKEDLDDNKYKGMYEGKNVIFIQVESLDAMLLNNKINGQEITPNLNKLLNNSIYFENIYEQNRDGGSSDCDLIVNTGVLPLSSGMTFYKYPENTFTTMSRLLKEKNYATMSSHPETGIYSGGFNWAEAHKSSLDFEKVYDSSQLNGSEVIFLGLSDKDYLEGVKEKLKELETPFFNYSITVTSHGTFNDLPDEYKYLDLPKEINGSIEENDNILGDYFQNFRYVDEQIGKFVSDIENDEKLKDTVFVIYGDHSCLHRYYHDRVVNVDIEEQWWQDTEKKVPLIVYTKDQKPEVVSTYGGQVDLMPTMSYMMGIDREKFEDTIMGRILVNTNRNSTITYTKNYDGSIICELKGEVNSEEEKEHVMKSYDISDKFIRGNYLEWLNNKK